MLARFFSFARKEDADKESATSTQIDQKKLEDLAVLANLIYSEDVDDPWKFPKGWYRYTRFHPEYWPEDSYGYMGAIFFKYDEDGKRPAEIAIIHRGTIINEVDNLLGGLAIAMNMVPKQMKVAGQWIDKELDLWRNRMDGYGDTVDKVSTWHVGHSLGAVLANCTYSRLYPNHGTHPGRIQSVGFENPGTGEIVMDYLISDLKMDEISAKSRMEMLAPFAHSYQADINIINTCNKQWGNVNHVKIPYRYTLPQYPKLPNPTDQIASSYLANLYYIQTYSFIDQHEMENMLNHIKQGAVIVNASDRQHGFANGYRQYLDGEKRKDYWLGYFQIVWDNDEQIRRVFHNKYDSFANFMFGVLRDNQNLALLKEDDFVKSEIFKFKTSNIFSLYNQPKTSIIADESILHDFYIIEKETTQLNI